MLPLGTVIKNHNMSYFSYAVNTMTLIVGCLETFLEMKQQRRVIGYFVFIPSLKHSEQVWNLGIILESDHLSAVYTAFKAFQT